MPYCFSTRLVSVCFSLQCFHFSQLCSITAVCYLAHARFCSSNGTQQLHGHVKTNLLVGLIRAEIKTAPALLDFPPRSSVFLLGCLCTSNSIVWKKNFFLRGFNKKVNLLKNFNVSVNCHPTGQSELGQCLLVSTLRLKNSRGPKRVAQLLTVFLCIKTIFLLLEDHKCLT